MKVVLLAGGYGTRISEYTESIPKPMIPIGGRPILWHIMKIYEKFGHNDFYVALGYKSEVIKDYFLKYRNLNSDFSINLKTGAVLPHQIDSLDWNITLVSTGLDTMTGGRVKRMKEYLGEDAFLLTYGDGLANINIDKLIEFHRKHGKMVTMTAVRPSARFGELELSGVNVSKFKEKPQLDQGWINGGFFVIEPKFLDFIDGDEVMLERAPLERAALEGELIAYQHESFWQCMDTKRDHDYLCSLWDSGVAPWV